MNGEVRTIDCGEELDISAVAQLHQRICEAADGEQALTLDAGRLVRIDGAGIQLLTSVFIDARRRGYSVQWGATVEALHRGAELLGVTRQLELPSQADSHKE